MDEEYAARFLGELNTGPGPAPNSADAVPWTRVQGAVPQREADLMPLMAAAARGDAGAAEQLAAERARRSALDAAVLEAVRGATLSVFSHNVAVRLGAAALGAERLMQEPVPAPCSEALVDDWDCLRGMVNAWCAVCGPLDQYGMRHTRAFANLCNLGVTPDALGTAAQTVCAVADA